VLIVVLQQLSLKMSIGYLKKKTNTKARKGISPVIATVILVAVAVVIAAALAGFASSLFGTYSSQGAAVNVKSLTLQENGDYALEMVNNGNTKDTIVSISVPPNPASSIDVDLAPHTSTAAPLTGNMDLGPVGQITNGSTVTVKINMASGVQLTQSVIVAA